MIVLLRSGLNLILIIFDTTIELSHNAGFAFAEPSEPRPKEGPVLLTPSPYPSACQFHLLATLYRETHTHTRAHTGSRLRSISSSTLSLVYSPPEWKVAMQKYAMHTSQPTHSNGLFMQISRSHVMRYASVH